VRALTLAVALFACAAPAPRLAAPTRPLHVRLVGINDFHGAISAGRQVAGHPVGSAGVLVAWLRAAERGLEGHTIFVSAGDLVGASPPASALLEDEPAVSLLNLLANDRCHPAGSGPDATIGGETRFEGWLDPGCNVVATVGNHEFDEGRTELLRLLLGGNHPRGPFLSDPWSGAHYPTLAANVVDARTGETLLPPYVVKRIEGVPVGFIGLVLRATPTVVTPAGVAGLDFLDEAETANRYVERLAAQGVRVIVVILHQGGSQPWYSGPTAAAAAPVEGEIVDLVRRLDDRVDVVMSAHTHQFTNALLPGAGPKPILVTQAYSNGTAFAQVDLQIDPRSQAVLSKSARIQTTWAHRGPGRNPDPAASRLEAAAEERVTPLVTRVVATSAAPLRAVPGRAGESPLGDLVADAQRAAVPGATAAFLNPGGVRADLPAGPIRWGQLFAVQPFGNALVAMTLTGEELKELLEQQWLGQDPPRILQVSGVSYAFSASAPAGAKVRDVRIGDAPLDPRNSYRVVVNEFLASGGDGFTLLTQGRERTVGPNDLDALAAYLGALPQPVEAPQGGRIQAAP